MEKFNIERIRPYIQNKIQYLELFLRNYNNQTIDIDFNSIKKLIPEMKITEVEILLDSSLAIEFYAKGELLPNNTIITNKSTIKNISLSLNGTFSDCYEKNKNSLLSFNKIYEVQKYWSRNLKPIIQLRAREFCELEYSQLRKWIDIPFNEINQLTGCYISPIWYQEGELSEKYETFIRKSNVILKELNLRTNNTLGEQKSFM